MKILSMDSVVEKSDNTYVCSCLKPFLYREKGQLKTLCDVLDTIRKLCRDTSFIAKRMH